MVLVKVRDSWTELEFSVFCSILICKVELSDLGNLEVNMKYELVWFW